MSDKICFFIAPIGEPESETRKRSDQVLEHVIKPAVEVRGYSPVRADEMPEPGNITKQVIQHIVDAPLVIADLTESNPNVFYEIAVRHAIGKPIVQIIKEGEEIAFHLKKERTIYVNLLDPDKIKKAIKEIIRQIESLETFPSGLETPISDLLECHKLRQSDNPEQRSRADPMSRLRIADEGPMKSQENTEFPVQINKNDPSASPVDKEIADSLSLEQREVEISKLRDIAQKSEASNDALAAADAYFRIANIYSSSDKDLGHSINCYDLAIKWKPKFFEAHVNRAIVKSRLGRHQDAIVDYDRAIKLNPRAIKLNPDLAGIYSNRGDSKAELGRHQDAIVDYDRAIKLNPDLAEAYSNRGISKAKLGRHQDAIVDYDKAIKREPDLAGPYVNRGNAKSKSGRHQDAIVDYDKAINLNKELFEAYASRGKAKIMLGRHQDAIVDYDRAIELNPEDARARKHRALVKIIAGFRDEARLDFKTALELAQNSNDVDLVKEMEQCLHQFSATNGD